MGDRELYNKEWHARKIPDLHHTNYAYIAIKAPTHREVAERGHSAR